MRLAIVFFAAFFLALPARAADEPKAAPTAAERAEAKRLAQEERDKAEKRRRDALIAQCVIKPVMTDAEIAKCREASR